MTSEADVDGRLAPATDPENLSPGRQVDALKHIHILKFFLAECSKN